MKRRARRAEPFEIRRRDASREWLEQRLAALPELELRRLFSGAGLYSADVIFGIHTRDGRLYFKVDATSVDDFLAKGAEPFCPRPGQTLGRYYEVPSDVADDDDELLTWARRAVVASQPSRSPPARKILARRAKAGVRAPRVGQPAERATKKRSAKKRSAEK